MFYVTFLLSFYHSKVVTDGKQQLLHKVNIWFLLNGVVHVHGTIQTPLRGCTGTLNQPITLCVRTGTLTQPITLCVRTGTLTQPITLCVCTGTLTQPITLCVYTDALNQPIPLRLCKVHKTSQPRYMSARVH